jgi:hypothetical protein
MSAKAKGVPRWWQKWELEHKLPSPPPLLIFPMKKMTTMSLLWPSVSSSCCEEEDNDDASLFSFFLAVKKTTMTLLLCHCCPLSIALQVHCSSSLCCGFAGAKERQRMLLIVVLLYLELYTWAMKVLHSYSWLNWHNNTLPRLGKWWY